MVVNACHIAEAIDTEQNIVSYATGKPCVEHSRTLDNVAKMTVWSKIMTQGIGTPEQFNEGQRIPTYFTTRLRKGMSKEV